MYRPRLIDDLVQDPDFLSSPECACFQEFVDKGICPTLKDAMLYCYDLLAEAKDNNHASWTDDIQQAIEAERDGRIFSPMFHVADSLLDVLANGTPHMIPESSWYMLIDFLKGTHRGQKGRVRTPDNEQYDARILKKIELLLNSGLSISEAYASLEDSECHDIRTIQRMVKRAKNDRKLADTIAGLAKLNMPRFFIVKDDDDI